MANQSMSGVKAGRAFVVIDAVDRTGTVLNKIANSFKKFGSTLMGMGTKTLFGGLTAMLPTVASLKLFTEFDDEIRRLGSRSVGTAKELSDLRAQALELGRTTSFTSTEVAALMRMLGSQGFKRSEIGGMVEDVLNLSRVSNSGPLDTLQSAQLVGSVLRTYRMEAGEAGRVTDLLAVTITNANLSLEDLQTAFTYAGQSAAFMKVPLEDTLATITTLRQMGGDASMIGSAMRNISVAMANPKQMNDFNELLGSLTGKRIDFSDSEKNLKNIPRLLFQIGDAIKGLGTAEQSNILESFFGKRGFLPAAGLMSGKNPFLDILGKMKGSAGLAKKMHDQIDSGIGGAWRRFTSAVEGVALALADVLAPALINLSTILENTLQNVAHWVNTNKEAVTAIVIFTASLIPLGVSLIGLGITFKLVGTALKVTTILTYGLSVSMRLISGMIKILRLRFLGLLAIQYLYHSALVVGKGIMLAYRLAMIAGAAQIAATQIALATATKGFMVLFTTMSIGLKAAIFSVGALSALSSALMIATHPAVLLSLAIAAATVALAAFVRGSMVHGSIRQTMSTMTGMWTWFSTEAGKAFTYLVNHAITSFNQLKSIMMTTGHGVIEALSMGEVDLAWKIGLAGLELGWYEFVNALYKPFQEFLDWFEISFSDTMKQINMFLNLMTKTSKGIAGSTGNIVEGIQKSIGSLFGSKKEDNEDQDTGPRVYGSMRKPNMSKRKEVEDRRTKQREKEEEDRNKKLEKFQAALDDLEFAKQMKDSIAEFDKAWDEVEKDMIAKEEAARIKDLMGSLFGPAGAADMGGKGLVGEIKVDNALRSDDLESLKQIWELEMRDRFGAATDIAAETRDATIEAKDALVRIEEKLED